MWLSTERHLAQTSAPCVCATTARLHFERKQVTDSQTCKRKLSSGCGEPCQPPETLWWIKRELHTMQEQLCLEVKAYKQAILCSSQAVQVTELFITAGCEQTKHRSKPKRLSFSVLSTLPSAALLDWPRSVTVFCSCGCCNNVVKEKC